MQDDGEQSIYWGDESVIEQNRKSRKREVNFGRTNGADISPEQVIVRNCKGWIIRQRNNFLPIRTESKEQARRLGIWAEIIAAIHVALEIEYFWTTSLDKNAREPNCKGDWNANLI